MSGSDLTAAQRQLLDAPETWHMVLTIASELERSSWGKLVAREQFLQLAVELLPAYAARYNVKRSVPFTAYARSRVRSGITQYLSPLQVDSQTRKLMIASYGGHAARRLLLEQYDNAPASAAKREQRREALNMALSQLPADYHDLIRKHYFEGKSLVSIAHSLKKGEMAISRLRADALARVRVELELRGFGMGEQTS